MIDTSKGFTLVRELDATPEQIWNAWTDEEQVAGWWHPRGMHTPRESVSVDARVGGMYSYTMVDDTTGEEYPTTGVYREVFPGERLTFTWGDPDDPLLISVAIEPLGDLTRLVRDVHGYAGMSGDGSFYDGWEQAIDSLAGYLMGQEPVG